MTTALFRHTRIVLATVVLLSVPAYSVYSLVYAGAPAAPGAELAPGDDPVHNGLRIVDAPDGARVAPAARGAGDEKLVKDWMFMGKGKPSPYQ